MLTIMTLNITLCGCHASLSDIRLIERVLSSVYSNESRSYD